VQRELLFANQICILEALSVSQAHAKVVTQKTGFHTLHYENCYWKSCLQWWDSQFHGGGGTETMSGEFRGMARLSIFGNREVGQSIEPLFFVF